MNFLECKTKTKRLGNYMEVNGLTFLFFYFPIVYATYQTLLICNNESKLNEGISLKITQKINYSYLNLNYNKTDPANVNEKYNLWKLDPIFLQQLWNKIQTCPNTSNTGHPYFMFSVINEGLIKMAQNWICSLEHSSFPKNGWALVCLDEITYISLLKITSSPENILFLKSNFTEKAVNNRQLIDFYNIAKIRPTIAHQLVMWNIDPIIADLDVIFFENPLFLFDNFSDFEFQSDSKEISYFNFTAGSNVDKWLLNAGYVRFKASEKMKNFFKIWLSRTYDIPKCNEQHLLKKILFKKVPLKWLNNDHFNAKMNTIMGGNIDLTFHLLDPILAANAGGVFKDGKEKWIVEAQRRNISKPTFIHFFHIGSINGKYKMIDQYNLTHSLNSNGQCSSQIPSGFNFDIWNKL